MHWLPLRQFEVQVSHDRAVLTDRLTESDELLVVQRSKSLRVTSNTAAAILLGPVAHARADRRDDETTYLTVQLLPPMWTWVLSLLFSARIFLEVFNPNGKVVIVQGLATLVACWVLMMLGFWLDPLEQKLRAQLADTRHERREW